MSYLQNTNDNHSLVHKSGAIVLYRGKQPL
ncbi:hypothetical protein PE36_02619 [Moritella sp. PE36]|nr:hypothetical protein PE36_02619 [Moritella sp. PE36]